jgi:hypothetical protein
MLSTIGSKKGLIAMVERLFCGYFSTIVTLLMFGFFGFYKSGTFRKSNLLRVASSPVISQSAYNRFRGKDERV